MKDDYQYSRYLNPLIKIKNKDQEPAILGQTSKSQLYVHKVLFFYFKIMINYQQPEPEPEQY
jgi:hypothetical protein